MKVDAKKIAKAKKKIATNPKYKEVKSRLSFLKKTEGLLNETLESLEKDIKALYSEKKTLLARKRDLEKKALEEGDEITLEVKDIIPEGGEGGEGGEFDDDSFEMEKEPDGDLPPEDNGAEDVVEMDEIKKEMMKVKSSFESQMKNLERKMKLSKK